MADQQIDKRLKVGSSILLLKLLMYDIDILVL
jgi:hypothetical protein